MKYSLVSREVIADCHRDRGERPDDGRRARLGGCDKNMPGGMMAILRA
jgi:dihydroxy-acid dehydratase